MSEEHESFIKTPKQLLIIVVLAFAVPIAIAVMASQFVTAGRKGDLNEETTARLILPVAKIQLAAAPAGGAAVPGARGGEQVVKAVCGACHESGAAGAPKIGDKAAWGPRLALGLDGLTRSVIAGKGAMPPKGGGADLQEAEIARAVAFMANKSGANFKEPAAPAAAQAAPATPAAAPAAAAPAAAKADGKGIYDKTCVVCHGTGVAGAPKVGDKAAWGPRIAQGIDALAASAAKGKNAMPPKGGNAALSDAEVKAAVEYMVAQSK